MNTYHLWPLLRAKLLARSVRSALIVAVSSLLFGIALAGFALLNGLVNSLQSFSEDMYQGRQFVQATHLEDVDSLLSNKIIQNEAQAIYSRELLAIEAEARKLGITFDRSLVVPPLRQVPGGADGEMLLDLSSRSAQQAIQKYEAIHRNDGEVELERMARQYNGAGVKRMYGLDVEGGASMTLMYGRREARVSFSELVNASGDFISNAPLRLVDESAVRPFINRDVRYDNNQVPILIPYSAAETILELQPLSRNATEADIINRLAYLNERTPGVVFFACYRNATSNQQINDALSQQLDDDSEARAGVIYELPDSESCEKVGVLSDNRSLELRQRDEDMYEVQKLLGNNPDPDQRKVEFKVVGVMPDTAWTSDTSANGVISMAQSLLGPSLLGQPTITTQAYDDLPQEIRALFKEGGLERISRNTSYLVEFSNVADARQFILEKSCRGTLPIECQNGRASFQLAAFGSSGVMSHTIQETIVAVSKYILGAIVLVAVIIMAGTFGKIIADEKQETAVFRAVGARRIDIFLIYIAYALVLAFFASVVAIVLASMLSILIHVLLASELTVAMRLTYGVLSEDIGVNLFLPDIIGTLLIVVLIIVTGIISVIIPLQKVISKSSLVDDLKT